MSSTHCLVPRVRLPRVAAALLTLRSEGTAMTISNQTASRRVTPPAEAGPCRRAWQPEPLTVDGCLQCLEALAQRIHGYVQFMCQIGTLSGTSAEAKDKAVLAFYERLAVLERQLGRIQEDLQLG